jgi:hypothetical protein
MSRNRKNKLSSFDLFCIAFSTIVGGAIFSIIALAAYVNLGGVL